MAKPGTLPEWATDETGIVEPDAGLKATGWVPDQRPPAQYFNWFKNLVYKWISWFDTEQDSVISAAGLTPDGSSGQLAEAIFRQGWLNFLKFAIMNTPTDDPQVTDAIWGVSYNASSQAYIAAGEGSIWVTGAAGAGWIGGSWAQYSAGGGYSDNFLAVASSPTVTVIVGENGEIQTTGGAGSPSQTSPATPGGANDLNGVAYSPTLGMFCAVGENGKIYTSTTPTTAWTSRTAGSSYTGDFNAIAWDAANSGFIAVGDSAEIQTSSDGITWVRRSTGPGPDLTSIAVDGVYAVAGFSTGTDVYVRTVGSLTSWSTVAVSYHKYVTSANGIFIVQTGSGSGSGFRFSLDGGATWEFFSSKGLYDISSSLHNNLVFTGDRLFSCSATAGIAYSMMVPPGV